MLSRASLSLLLLFALPLLAQEKQRDETEPDLCVHDRSAKGYVLRAPEVWRKAASQQTDLKLERTDPKCNLNVVVVDIGDPAKVEFTPDVLKAIAGQAMKTFEEAKILRVKVEEFKGRKSGWYDIIGRLAGEKAQLRQRQYIVLHKKMGIIVTLTSGEKAWPQCLPLFKALLWDMRFVG